MLPGDEIKVRCDYKSFHQNATTVFGESTYDEMCYGFIGYWDPIEGGFNDCLRYKTSEYCGLSPTKVTNCTLSSFNALYANLPNVCDSTCKRYLPRPRESDGRHGLCGLRHGRIFISGFRVFYGEVGFDSSM